MEDVDARECHDSIGNLITGTRVGEEIFKVTDVTFRNVQIECRGGVENLPGDPREYSGQYPNYNWCGGKLPAWGYYIRHAENVTFENSGTKLIGSDVRPEFVLVNTKAVPVDGTEYVR